MRFDNFSFGSIQIDGSTYEHDVVIDRGEKTYPGNATNSSSVVVHTADYP
jgi:hypothetical protein